MDYLNKYISEEDIKYLFNNMEDIDINQLAMHEDKTKEIIEYLISIGVKNIKDVIKYHPEIFYESVDFIKSVIEEKGIDDIVELINNDIMNLNLFD